MELAFRIRTSRSPAEEFVSTHAEFEIVEPEFAFNEGSVEQRVTYWPSGFLKRVH